jgi:DNA helicase IV
MKLADFVQDRKIVTEGRKGRVPIHFIQNSEESAVKAAIDWLSIALERYPNQLTLVICANNQEAKEFEGFLRPNFGSQVRLETSNNFSFDAGIIISTVRYVRGLEFTNVLIWNVSKQNYPNNPMTRNALYVAITRAEENLCLINYGKPSLLLPSGRVKLTRVNVEEEE